MQSIISQSALQPFRMSPARSRVTLTWLSLFPDNMFHLWRTYRISQKGALRDRIIWSMSESSFTSEFSKVVM